MRRLIAGFSKGTGIASPALILVWFVLGAGLTWFHLHLSGAGVALASGTVTTVNSDPQFGTHISLDSSTLDFFFDSTDYPRLPDVRVGDHVDILTQAEPQGWAVAAQSSRGLWIDTIYGDEVAPFSPHTWFLHEILSWAALAVGIAAALLGVVSLLRWIPSTQQVPTPNAAVAFADGIGTEPIAPAAETVMMDATQGAEPRAPEPGPTGRDRTEVAAWVGGITVTVLPALELVGVVSALESCSSIGFADPLLIVVTLGLFTGAAATLILARWSRGRLLAAPARRLGVVALVIGVASVPVNVMIVGLSGFCVTG